VQRRRHGQPGGARHDHEIVLGQVAASGGDVGEHHLFGLHGTKQALGREGARAAALRVEDHLDEAGERWRTLLHAVLLGPDRDQAGHVRAAATERRAHGPHHVQRRALGALGQRRIDHHQRLVRHLAEQAPQARQGEGRKLGAVEQERGSSLFGQQRIAPKIEDERAGPSAQALRQLLDALGQATLGVERVHRKACVRLGKPTPE